MTPQEQKQLLSAVGKFVKEQLAPLKERILQLEASLGEFGFRGVWHEGIVYRAGNFVSLGGSMWHCNQAETTSRPSTDNSDWKICVKRGRDAPRRPTPGVGR